MKFTLRRLAAFLIDYLVIGVYALTLFGIVTLVFRLSDSIPTTPDPIKGQVIGFFTLTLPVFLYFFLSEAGANQATLGKRLFKIRVYTKNGKKAVFRRNFFKLLPWEIAHTGVHWMIYYSDHNTIIPIWVWIALLLPQLILIVFVVSLFATNGKRSLYDSLSNTEVHFAAE